MESPQRLKAIPTVVEEDERLNGKHEAAASSGEETVVDVSAKSWDVSLFEKPPTTSAQELYVYHNTFHLIPRSIRRLERLKTLKFFANEIEILPQETVNLAELESLQVKVSLPGISGISLQKLKSLRKLELHRVPQKLKAFSIFSDVSGLKCLTKLSICHFAIRYLPPEIGCLKRLEELDLSFNKLKNLPDALAELVVLKSLRVANNKLMDLPSGISCMRSLESLDLSNNRLTSLASINLTSMDALYYLNLQYNRLPYDCQIPPWINCNLEGNEGASNSESGSLVKEGWHEFQMHRIHTSWSCKGCPSVSSTSDPPSSSRCIMNQKMKKGWKKQGDFQQIARQECLNVSRKSIVSEHAEDMPVNMGEEIHSSLSFVAEDSTSDVQVDVNEINLPDRSAMSKGSSKLIKDAVNSCKCIVTRRNSVMAQHGHADDKKTTRFNRGDISEKDVYSCIADSTQSNKNNDYGNGSEDGHRSLCSSDVLNVDDGCSSVGAPNVAFKSKRHFDGDLDNPKPSKFRRPIDDCSYLARKYSMESFCSTDDHIPDGFYDAGRDRQFMSLDDYEQSVCVGSREVILVDRGKDEELDAIALSAHLFLSRFQRSNLSSMEGVFDDFLRASILALYVSDCFGGSDRSTSVLRSRRSVVGSTKLQPFICTCCAGCTNDSQVSSQPNISELNLNKLCESSMQAIKETNNSNIVPLGNLRFGVCRHRAVLLKYLCDRAEPRIPCELVRGYLDFMPHAWNIVLVRKGNKWNRMVVDACYPIDIRDEDDPEFYCRYVPQSRFHAPLTQEGSSVLGCLIPTTISKGTEKFPPQTVFHCKIGVVDTAVKVRSLEADKASEEDIRKLEYAFLGELRILGALRRHKCIVEIYGHQFYSKWVPAEDGKQNKIVQLIIVMEYVKGGSLKCYLDKLSESGEKHVPLDVAVFIARDVASALVELHSKSIIHRDIKSDNVLIDLDCKAGDGSPVVKLSDFDRSVPLNSSKHTCCIAHIGIHPPEVCVGTPRWMAPEVVQAMHQRNSYGLEVDIWSYGCLLYELLTLQLPYGENSEQEIYDLLHMKQRPELPSELAALAESKEEAAELELGPSEADAAKRKLLVDLFCKCTQGDPADRPTAIQVYNKLCSALRQ